MARIPLQQRVNPIGRAKIVNNDGSPTDFYARQWQSLIDLVSSVLRLQDDSTSNAARITVLEDTEIGGDNVDIEPGLSPLSAGNITLNLSDTAVTPGVYGDATNSPQITVDQKGRVTGLVNVPITGGASLTWTVVSTTTIAAGTASVPVTNLGAYSELLILFSAVTASAATARRLRVSTNNGATYLSTTADYTEITGGTGVTGTSTSLLGSNANAGSRSGYWWLVDIGTTNNPKFVLSSMYAGSFVNTGSAIDAVEFSNVSGTLSAGTFIVMGR